MSKLNKIPSIKIPTQTNENNPVLDLNRTIKEQIEQIAIVQNKGIKNVSNKEIENLLDMVDSLVLECNQAQNFHFNKNENIIELLYRYHSISLEYKIYRVEQKMDQVEEQSKELRNGQEELKHESHNLVYTILSFITAFSIISATVTAIDKMEDIKYICVFIIFIVFILMTTLIGLDNFYRSEKGKNKFLKNNYFIWGILLITMILFFIVICISDAWNKNKEEVMIRIENKVIEYIEEQEIIKDE